MSRGRNAKTPWEIPPKGWWDILMRIWRDLGPDHISLIAAGCAFYGLLALFPAVTALMAIAGLVTEPAVIVEQLDAMAAALPAEAADIVLNQAREVAGSDQGGLGLAAVAGILIALYSASKGVQALMEGLNVVYSEEEERGFVKLTAMRLGLTLLMVVGVLLAAVAVVAIPAMLAVLNLGSFTEFLARILRWPVLLVLAGAGFALIYRWGPSRVPPHWRWLTPGVILTCVLWVAGTLGFAWYVQSFGSYNETFGALAGVVILLMWMWLSAFIVLLGAKLDAEAEHQTRRDTTVEGDQPMGERGAHVADHLGESQADKG